MNIFNAVSQEPVDISGVLILCSIMGGLLLLVIIVGFFAGDSEKKTKDAWMKSLEATNSRYGVNLSQNDIIILKQIPQNKPGINFIWDKQITYKGPSGDDTINVLQDGNVISNVSLEDNSGDWILKTNGVELTRAA